MKSSNPFGVPVKSGPTNTLNPFENVSPKGPIERHPQGGLGAGLVPLQSPAPAEHNPSNPEHHTSSILSDKLEIPGGEVGRQFPPNQRPLPDLNAIPLHYASPLQLAGPSPSTPDTKPTSGLKSKLGAKLENRAGGQYTPTHSPRASDQARQTQIPRQRTQADIDRATACGSIIIPSLRAAISRRARHLSRLEPGRYGANTSPEDIRRWEHGVHVHRNMENVADELIRSFAALHCWDMEDPIPMAGGIDDVLDVFLEEVLVRIAAPKRPSSP